VAYKKVYLDINIVLDILDNSRQYSKEAKLLWQKIVEFDSEVVISEDMLSTIYYIHKDKSHTLEFLGTIKEIWTISSFGKDVINRAIEVSLRKQLDFENVLQCLCAKKNECDMLITNDNKFYDCGINVYSSKEFLDEQ